MSFPSWQETFLALHRADTVEDLWSVLRAPHGIRSSSAWEEPFLLFQHFHSDSDENAVITAVLLCTDHRWRNASNRLIGHLADSAILGDDGLDELAAVFLEVDVPSEIDENQIMPR